MIEGGRGKHAWILYASFHEIGYDLGATCKHACTYPQATLWFVKSRNWYINMHEYITESILRYQGIIYKLDTDIRFCIPDEKFPRRIRHGREEGRNQSPKSTDPTINPVITNALGILAVDTVPECGTGKKWFASCFCCDSDSLNATKPTMSPAAKKTKAMMSQSTPHTARYEKHPGGQ